VVAVAGLQRVIVGVVMAETLGFLQNKKLYLISFDLNPSKGRGGIYGVMNQRIAKLGAIAKPTMQIQVIAHSGNAATIRDHLRGQAYLRGPKKGQPILLPKDRIFVMKLKKSVAWNRLKEKDLTAALIEDFSGQRN
jgi:hypothetical protein